MDLAKISSILGTAIPGVEIQLSGGRPVGLKIGEGVTREECQTHLAPMLGFFGGSLLFFYGDSLLAYEKRKWGQMYEEASDESGYDPGTLSGAKSVCQRIQLPRRRGNLSYSHHYIIAFAFEDEQMQDFWLDRAEREKLTRKELRRLVQESKATPSNAKFERSEDIMIEQEYCIKLATWSQKQNPRDWTPERKQIWRKDIKPLVDFYNSLE